MWQGGYLVREEQMVGEGKSKKGKKEIKKLPTVILYHLEHLQEFPKIYLANPVFSQLLKS
jgi:hypothetical protein